MDRSFNKYEIISRLGSGHYADVYEAFDITNPDEYVAIKILKDDFSQSPDFPQIKERFTREAEETRKLHHPGLVEVKEHGLWNGRLYIVMELVRGKSLDKIIHEKKKLSWAETLSLAQQIARTLDYLHQKEIIHRDLKPSNILVRKDGVVKIADLGLAKFKNLQSITFSTGILGTPPYMAPESWIPESRSHQVSPATDIYALGCIVYEMLTGEQLFSMTNPNEAYYLHVVRGAFLPSDWPAGIPRNIRQVLGFAVQKNHGQRYKRAGDFARALQQLPAGAVIVPQGGEPLPDSQEENLWFAYTCFRDIKRLQWYAGYLWAATDGGILRLDPENWRAWRLTLVEGLPENEVVDLAFDPTTGVGWIATRHGISLARSYYESRQPIHSVASFSSQVARAISIAPGLGACCATDGGIVLAHEGGVVEYPKDQQGRRLNVYSLLTGGDGRTYAGTSAGIFTFDGSAWGRLPGDETNNAVVRVMRLSPENTLYAGTDRGVFVYRAAAWRQYSLRNGLPANLVVDLAYDEDNHRMWVATPGGLAIIENDLCRAYPIRPIQKRRLQALTWHDGFLWMGFEDGLGYLEKDQFYPVSQEFGLAHKVVNVAREDSQGLTWFGTEEGLSMYSARKGPLWNSYPSLGKVHAIAESQDGNLWFGTQENGVYELRRDKNGSTWRQHRASPGGLPHDQINDILASSAHGLWAATRKGIGIWNGTGWKALRKEHGLISEEVLCLAPDPFGGIWCGTRGGGAQYWDGARWLNPGIDLGPSVANVYGIAYRTVDGSLWFATDQGALVRNKEGVMQRFPLPAQAIHALRCVFADHRGTIWFGSDHGAYRCRPERPEITLLTQKDGLVGNQVHAIWESPDHRLWFATHQGASCLY